MSYKLRHPISGAHCRTSRHTHNNQGGTGFLDSIKSVLSGAKNIAFGDIGTALSNAAPSSDANARPLFSGEIHTMLKLPNGKMGRANFMGPGTHLPERLRRGDPPRTYSDKESMAHDARYFLATSPADVKRADLKMIDVMQKGKLNKLDNPINITQGLRVIRAKNALENMTGKNFVDYGPGKNEEGSRPLVQAKLNELEKQGFGKKARLPGDKLKSKLIKQMAKGRLVRSLTHKNIRHPSRMSGEGILTNIMESLSTSAGKLLLPFIKKMIASKYDDIKRNTAR
jgi:hypothetical protein